MHNNPNTKPELFKLVKELIAILLVSFSFFALIAQLAEDETLKELLPVLTMGESKKREEYVC